MPQCNFCVFPLCLPCRQCSSRSPEQAQGEGGEGAQGEKHSPERGRGEWSRVCKPGERSGQANYAISGQRAKQAKRTNILVVISICFIKTLPQQCGAGPWCSNSQCALNAEELCTHFLCAVTNADLVLFYGNNFTELFGLEDIFKTESNLSSVLKTK